MSKFKQASRKAAKARIALAGPSGSGKTASALRIARGLVGLSGRIAVIDTERGSASLYAGIWGGDFCVLELEPPFTPASYVAALRDAATEGFDAVVVDSLTHAWAGQGGALEMVDAVAKRQKTINTYTAWRDVTPEHQRLIDAMLRFPGHLVATMRSKVEYVLQTDSRGKQAPQRVGMAPIQREGMDYEFTLFGELNIEHELIVQKSRLVGFDLAVVKCPDEAFGGGIAAWLAQGVPVETVAAEPAKQATTTPPSPTQEELEQVVSGLLVDLPLCTEPFALGQWWDAARKNVPRSHRTPLQEAFAQHCAELHLDARAAAQGQSIAPNGGDV